MLQSLPIVKTTLRMAALGLIFCAAPLSADLSGADISVLQQAQAAILAGEYTQAETLLSDEQSAQSLTLRAESMSTRVMLGLTEKPHKLAGRARKLAQQALELDPDNAEIKIQYALAYGFEARTAGIVKAWRKKLPQKCKLAIDRAFAAAPNDARTHALLGAWHLGLVRKAGEKRASKMFDASLAVGMKHYDEALRRDPTNIVILGNYAISLLGIDSSLHKDKAQSLIAALDSAPARSATDRDIQSRMRPLLPLLKAQDAGPLIEAIDQLMNEPREDAERYSRYE